jgi:isochorismate synthase
MLDPTTDEATPANAALAADDRRPTARIELVGEAADLLDVLAAHRDGPAFYWDHPDGQEALLGIGEAARVETAGPGRLERASERARALLADLRIVGGEVEGAPRPLIVGGFAFRDEITGPEWAEFAPCRFVLPATTWIVRLGRLWRIDVDTATGVPRAAPAATSVASTAGVQADAESDASWEERVRRVLARIDAGDIDKVVLSRSVALSPGAGFDPLAALRRIRDGRPGCIAFCVRPDRSAFFGSTPELLLRTEGGQLKTQALAGTAPRSRDQAEDRARGAALLASPKDRREHQAVVAFLRAKLAELCTELITDPAPAVVRYPEAMHLRTRLHSRLREPSDALSLAARLHPTPAVCGVPQDRAARILAEEESHRGWYSGAVGWMDTKGDGSFAVALRSALAADRRLVLWAGAGIVAGSDPEAERAEVELKLDAVRAHLENGAR